MVRASCSPTPGWRTSIRYSVTIATISAALAVLIATPLAYVLRTYRIRLAPLLYTLGILPFMLPPIISALGMQVFWLSTGHVGRIENVDHRARDLLLDAAARHDLARDGDDGSGAAGGGADARRRPAHDVPDDHAAAADPVDGHRLRGGVRPQPERVHHRVPRRRVHGRDAPGEDRERAPLRVHADDRGGRGGVHRDRRDDVHPVRDLRQPDAVPRRRPGDPREERARVAHPVDRSAGKVAPTGRTGRAARRRRARRPRPSPPRGRTAGRPRRCPRPRGARPRGHGGSRGARGS